MSPASLIRDMEKNSGEFTLPGWEPERLANFAELNEAYAGVTHEDMYENTTRGPRSGYGLYDRALGTQYLFGLWDMERRNLES